MENMEFSVTCCLLAFLGHVYTRVRTNFCTVKNLHGSTSRLRGTCGTGQIFERLSVQVWDLFFQVPNLYVQFRRSRVNLTQVELCKFLSVQKFVRTRVNVALIVVPGATV